MANNFSDDSNCKALWKFENGALGTDSKGTNTLTVSGVDADTSDYKEGSCSAEFVRINSDYAYITDANLDAGYPLKNGDSNKKISVCFWFKCPSDPDEAGYIYSKYDTVNNKRTFAISADWSVNRVIVWIGYNSGASGESIGHASSITTDRWYHVGVTYQDSDKSYRIRIWDDTAQAILGSDATGNTTNNINIEDATTAIGHRNDGARVFGGNLDELVVFDDILSTDEIDAIRAGTYGAVTAVDLVVADATNALTSDNVDLTQVHNVAISDCVSSLVSGVIALTQVHELELSNGVNTLTSDNADIVEIADVDLIVQNATSSITSPEVVLTRVVNLIIENCIHSVVVGVINLTQTHKLLVNDSMFLITNGETGAFVVDGTTIVEKRIFSEDINERLFSNSVEKRIFSEDVNERSFTTQVEEL